MALRTSMLHASFVGGLAMLLSGCPGFGGESSTTVVDSGMATTGFNDEFNDEFDEGLDDGLDSGGIVECLQYAEACLQDPYCACYVECASEGLDHNTCLAKCNLAQTPYWAQQYFECVGGFAGGQSG